MRGLIAIFGAICVASLTVGYAQGNVDAHNAMTTHAICTTDYDCARTGQLGYGVDRELIAQAMTTCYEDDPCWDWTTMGDHDAQDTRANRAMCVRRGGEFVSFQRRGIRVIRCDFHVHIPGFIRRARAKGFTCWREIDVDTRTGKGEVNWYCDRRKK